MVGRLKPGARVEQAQQQIDALNARNLDRFPNMKQILINAGFHTVVAPLQEDLVREVRGTLYLLWGGVLFVLAIGAVNITNLVLVRSTRADEGAGDAPRARRRLRAAHAPAADRDGAADAVGGGLAGSALGYWGLALLPALGLEALPRSAEIRIDGTVVAFTLALALAVGAARRPGADPEPAPHESEPGVPRGRAQRHERPRRARGAPRAGREPGGVRVHAADRRRPAARELRARARRRSPGSTPTQC